MVRVSTRVATSPFKSNSLRGQGDQSLRDQSNFLPWPRKEFDWNGDVATRVDTRTTKVKFFKIYLSEGMSDPGKIIRPGR